MRAIVTLPMMIFDADGARLIGVPEIVTAGAPGATVWLPITYSEALLGKIVSPPNVRGCRGLGAVAKGIVIPSITAFDAEGARLMGVPDTVIAGEPAASVWPSMYWDAVLAAMIWSPIVRSGRDNGEDDSNLRVLLPMTTSEADGAKEISVPET